MSKTNAFRGSVRLLLCEVFPPLPDGLELLLKENQRLTEEPDPGSQNSESSRYHPAPEKLPEPEAPSAWEEAGVCAGSTLVPCREFPSNFHLLMLRGRGDADRGMLMRCCAVRELGRTCPCSATR